MGPGAVILVPPAVPHGFRNRSGGTVRLHAVFAGHVVGTRLLERSPAPGTEDEPLPPPSIIDFRTFEDHAGTARAAFGS